MSNDYFETVRLRALELQAKGLDLSHAFGKAHLESLLQQWPTAWGDDYQVLIYGDFDPPGKDLEFPSLGIRVLADPKKKSVVSSARTVLAAQISIKERSIAEITDAVRRVNILLGAWTLVTWGNAPIGWWSHFFPGGAGEIKTSIDHADLDRALAKVTACFGSDGKKYIEECFTQPIEADRLYNIRNAINHGDIDAENPEELLRVEARLHRLFMIVWGMFGRLVPFPYPLDSALKKSGEAPPSGCTA